jgi:hypothetical protein
MEEIKHKWQIQDKIKLTREIIEKAERNSIIYQGEGYIEHPWFNDAKNNLEDDGRSVRVKFVIYRGGIADWCIYHSLDANLEPARYLDGTTHLMRSFEDIKNHGAKLHREKIIQGLIDCDDDTLSIYRH